MESLFQQGLIKVVFATETLAAGINMPARTAVITTLTRRKDGVHVPLLHNELLQMAGRAGRRGFDVRGHAVVTQTRCAPPLPGRPLALANDHSPARRQGSGPGESPLSGGDCMMLPPGCVSASCNHSKSVHRHGLDVCGHAIVTQKR